MQSFRGIFAKLPGRDEFDSLSNGSVEPVEPTEQEYVYRIPFVSCVHIELVLQVLSSFQTLREKLHPVLKCWNFPNPWHSKKQKALPYFLPTHDVSDLEMQNVPSNQGDARCNGTSAGSKRTITWMHHTDLRVENQLFFIFDRPKYKFCQVSTTPTRFQPPK